VSQTHPTPAILTRDKPPRPSRESQTKPRTGSPRHSEEPPISPSLLLAYPLAFVTTFLLGGSLGEEPGWRGFALPRLQNQYGPLLGSTILGVLWAFWHFPLFWSNIWTPRTFANMWMFVVMIILLTIVMSFVFNNAKGSLLITMLLHASMNTFADKIIAPMFPAPVLDEYALLPELIGFGVLAVKVIFATRGRLGFQQDGEYRGPVKAGLAQTPAA
jgi:membrane protease YdiL (CAAX protease family)